MRPRTLAALASVAAVTVSAVALAPPPASAAPTDLFISEYVEGSSFNKAIELYNGTGAGVDLTAGNYRLQVFFNGSTTPTANIALTGTVAAGDVFVLAHADAAAAILAAADQTTSASLYNGDDAVVLVKGSTVLDSLGQVGVDPGTEWGSGLTSTADNTLRRSPSVTAGDTDPGDVFDPAAQWTGLAADTVDGLGTHSTGGGPVDQPATVTCGSVLATPLGTAATREVTATDPDDTIVDLAVSGVAPAPASGSIARTAFTPAAGTGGTATATVTVSAEVPAGSYTVTLAATDTDGTTTTCALAVTVTTVLTVGEVQGPTTDGEAGPADRSPLAPPSGNGTSSTLYDVRGVIAQRTLALDDQGVEQHGFFLQSRLGATDGDPTSSDGVFVFMGRFTSLIGGYVPTVGDEVILRGRVSEYFNQTQLSSTSLVSKLASGLDVDTAVAVTDAVPPADLTAANRFWERYEGSRMRVRSGSGVVAGRDVFAGTADSEIWLVDRDDPVMDRADPYARRVFRDAHPLDNDPARFDDGNGNRIMLGTTGVKRTANDSAALLPPARSLDTLDGDALGGVGYSFSKYGIQVERAAFAAGADPSANHPPAPADRNREIAVATFNVENLYDYRDDPFDGCDFTGNSGCPGVSPPFDYVPASEAEYTAKLRALAGQVTTDLHAPDLILAQEAEDQDICSVSGGALVCGAGNNADGAPDTLQELALAISAGGGPTYAAAYDRTGADARGITSAFLYRADRLSLAPADAADPVLGAAPTVVYRSAGLPSNADVQNPKALNAVLPADVDRSTGVDGSNVYTRAPQVAKFSVAAAPGSTEHYTLWAVSNHFSSTPDRRVGQRREQATYGAAIVTAIETANAHARVVYGGDLNVFPRPDDPVATAAQPTPSDQLGPLYDAGLHNLWDDLVAEAPSSAYSYVFQGQTQTLDNLFVNGPLHADLVQMRAAHINADWPADHEADGNRGTSDHDPQVARFRSRASLSVADISVQEGDKGDTAMSFQVTVSRPLSEPVSLCATTLGLTAASGSDYESFDGCRTLAAGSTSVTFTVTVRGDQRVEPDEKLSLLVAGASGLILADPIAIGTIVNDD